MSTGSKIQLIRVISGGQIGVDQAALMAAREAGFETGGWAPRGYKTIAGPMPELLMQYGLEESRGNYAYRTKTNVWWADATLRLATDWESPGEKCTYRAIREYARPFLDIDVSSMEIVNVPMASSGGELICDEGQFDIALDFLAKTQCRVLNVAGNSRDILFHPVKAFLKELFERVKRRMQEDQALQA